MYSLNWGALPELRQATRLAKISSNRSKQIVNLKKRGIKVLAIACTQNTVLCGIVSAKWDSLTTTRLSIKFKVISLGIPPKPLLQKGRNDGLAIPFKQ